MFWTCIGIPASNSSVQSFSARRDLPAIARGTEPKVKALEVKDLKGFQNHRRDLGSYLGVSLKPATTPY
jgi:hypothetical protein